MLAPQEECFSNIVQDFLICTTIHKARQLGVFQSGLYVRITFAKMVRQTRIHENSENPYFNEYFVFEIKCSLMELLRLTILYEVKKHTICKKNPTLGELLIDMQSVWNQPNRCYFKKWGPLETPIVDQPNISSEGGGNERKRFLQIDLAIVSQASNPNTLLKPYEDDLMVLNKWQLHQDYDDIEKNLLDNINTGVRCNIRYMITFYRGIMTKKSNYMLQFRFHPFKGKTNVVRNTSEPSWNQEISFVWTYPSLAQTFIVQLLMHEHLQWKCVAEYELHFNKIAFNDKPSLGPTFLHFYDDLKGINYVGRLLYQIKSECLDTDSNHVMNIKQVPALDEKYYWQEENFLIEFIALQGDFIHCNGNNFKISLKLAEHDSNFLEFNLKDYPISNKKGPHAMKILKCFLQQAPFKSITLKVHLPDNRSKFESDVFLQNILDFTRTQIESFKLFQIQYVGHHQTQIKVLRNILMTVTGKIEQAIEVHRLDYTSLKEVTRWDLNRLVYLKDYFDKILEDLNSMRLKLRSFNEPYLDLIFDEVLGDLTKCCNQLQFLLATTLVQDEWPDLILVLLNNNKEFGFCRLNAKEFFYPSEDREKKYINQCWKLRNFIFKDIKCQHTCINCGCTVALIRGCLSIVAESENNEYSRYINPFWKHPEPFYWSPHSTLTNFKSHIFIHQAKIRPGADRNGLCDPYIRIMVCQCVAETAVLFNTLSPIWNTAISFDDLRLPGEFEWYLHNPPLVAIEIYDTDKKTATDYLGCGVLPLSVIKREVLDLSTRAIGGWRYDVERPKHALQKYELLKSSSPPFLKWVPIALNGIIRAEVLISGELVAVTETIAMEANGEVRNQASITVGIPSIIKPNMKNFVLEAVFIGFRNYQKRNFLTSKHRVKIMMADLVLTSGLSTLPINNSLNFLVLYAAGIVSLPEQLEYWPAIIATDVVVSSKGQEATLGATLIANSKRYLQEQNFIPCTAIDEEFEEETATSTLQIEEEDNIENSETQPLILKKSQTQYWQRIVKKLRSSKQRFNQTEELYDLKDVIDESEFNWWTKFYNSGFVEPCGAFSDFKHKLCIYQNELEKQHDFSYLNDWAEPVSMVYGVKYKKNSLLREEIYATLKLHLKITPCLCRNSFDNRMAGGGDGDGNTLKPLATALNPRYQTQLQSLAELVKIMVRVYIVQGIQLRPSEKNIQADSYVTIQLGQKHVTNRAEYVPNDSNPIFGKCIQVDGLLPREHILEISVFNHKDMKDDVIGSTVIDLEDRWRSKHRATVGIANEYSSSGYNKWHDNDLPSEILKELCKNNDMRPPKFKDNTIEVDGVIFEDETQIATDEDLQERLCLTVLRNFDNLPSFGYRLVPEHVETRSLYRNECPGIEQGKIQLWIELYDANLNIPPPIDIIPQAPQQYELRIIIYNVTDVVLNEKNIFGTAMSDIYLKGWCSNFDEAQSTDIHYRSLNGEGKFNWRMLFPLRYSSNEDMMIVKQRLGFIEEYEWKQPPILHLQIWDIDFLSPDDFLSSLEINLSGFTEPFETFKKCELLDVTYSLSSYDSTNRIRKVKSTRKLINLFKQKKVHGWFPMRGNVKDITNTQTHVGLAGKVELELEMLTAEEAKEDPVGLGREGPRPLAAPKRPKTSFNPFTHPWKGMKKIVFPKLGKLFIILLILLIIGFALFQFGIKIPVFMSRLGY